ncbi:sensor histidine kinase [Dactylosporangium sp. NPDC051541]|uniref:sensor histidine kinase n=1 Tax=Dactylosporangium sp. NPDC051541 TaxID=3363977 RepID=UPI0037BDBC05
MRALRHPLLRPAAMPGLGAVILTVALTAGTIAVIYASHRSEAPADAAGRYAYLLLAPPVAFAGGLIAALRPGNVIGVLMTIDGLGIAADEFVTAVFRVGRESGRSTGLGTWWLGNWLWTVPIAVLVLVILLFPTGRLPGPRWWPVAGVTIGWSCGLVLLAALGAGRYTGRPRFPGGAEPGDVGPTLHTIVHWWWLLFPAVLALVAAASVVRYRRAAGEERAQLRWLAAAAVCNALLWTLPPVHEVGSWARAGANLALWLVPAAIAVAVLRYRLYDIDRIINRAVVYGSLSIGIGVLYALLMTASAALVDPRSSLAAATVASVAVAALFAPLRDRLQRAVDRLLYGRRNEPGHVLSQLGRRLESALPQEEVLPAIVDTVAQALRLPYAAIELRRDGGYEPVCVRGTPAGAPVEFDLSYQGDILGRLILGPRAQGEVFPPAELELMRDLARHAGVAVHAVHLTGDLQRSRERLVTAREEERLRLRRDLHDGLGAALAGIAFRLDATAIVMRTDPADAAELLKQVRADLAGALSEIRQLVDGLRPPELDALGLVEAVRSNAMRLSDIFEVHVPEPLPPLPAAVEVAAYRIAAEAVTNVLRHSGATRCTVTLRPGAGLELDIEDDGRGIATTRPGFGLRSMRERAAELGGECRIEPRDPGPGTRISVRLPLPVPVGAAG